MISEAALFVADRLIAPLMALIEAVTAALPPCRPADPAWSLFDRLSKLLFRLGDISIYGIRRPRRPEPDTPAPKAEAEATPAKRAAATRHVDPAPPLPRRPGWILLALPDVAPAVAADLAALLADPAWAELLAASPSLERAFRPVLRGLGLDVAAPPPNAPTPRPTPPAPDPAPPPTPPSTQPSSQPGPAEPASRFETARPRHPNPRLFRYDTVTALPPTAP